MILQQISIETRESSFEHYPTILFSYKAYEHVNSSAYTHLMMIIHISLSLMARSIHGNNKRYFRSTLLHRDLLRWQAVYIHLSRGRHAAVPLNWLDTFTYFIKNGFGPSSMYVNALDFALTVVKFMFKNWRRRGGEVCYRVNSYQFHILYHDLLLYLMPKKSESFSRTMCVRYIWL